MALYISHTHLFDNAIREMTRFFSKKYLTDIISHSSINPLAHLSEMAGSDVRYDNFPLFIIESQGIKKGAVGLIDIEHITERKDEASLKDLVSIFPRHLNIIKQEANDLQMSYNDRELETMAIKGEKYLKKGYSDFLNWLQKKGIENNSKNWKFKIKSSREKEFRELIELEIIKLNTGINDLFKRSSFAYSYTNPVNNFLKGNIRKAAKELSDKITPAIVKDIVDLINKHIISNNLKHSSITASKLDYSMMASLRSMQFHRINMSGNTKTIFYNVPSLMNLENMKLRDDRYIVEQLVHIIFENLVKGEEIFYYNPGYYTRYHNLGWVRF